MLHKDIGFMDNYILHQVGLFEARYPTQELMACSNCMAGANAWILVTSYITPSLQIEQYITTGYRKSVWSNNALYIHIGYGNIGKMGIWDL